MQILFIFLIFFLKKAFTEDNLCDPSRLHLSLSDFYYHDDQNNSSYPMIIISFQTKVKEEKFF